jgi:hypothetical protein
MAKKYYAVKVGHKPGIFESWAECEAQTKGYSGAVFRGFTTKEEADNWYHESTNSLKQDSYGDEESGSGNLIKANVISTSPNIDETTPAPKLLPSDDSEIDTRRNMIATNFHDYLKKAEFGETQIKKHPPNFTRLQIIDGNADIYMTQKKPFPRLETAGSNLNSERKKDLKRLWRDFSLSKLPKRTSFKSNRELIENLLDKLRPYRELKFDFIHLAEAIIELLDEDINVNELRFDFNKIEELSKQLK